MHLFARRNRAGTLRASFVAFLSLKGEFGMDLQMRVASVPFLGHIRVHYSKCFHEFCFYLAAAEQKLYFSMNLVKKSFNVVNFFLI